MAIKFVSDLGAPLLVTAIDIGVDMTAPGYSKWATGILAVGGYLGAFTGWGGDFVKNVGIAALPAAAKNIYDWARGGTPVTNRASRGLSFHRTSSRAQGIGQTVKPGFENVEIH